MIMQMELWHIGAILETIIVVVVNKYQWGKNESWQSVAQLSPVQSSSYLCPYYPFHDCLPKI